MPGELLVILGAEASILVFVAAMTLYAKRMDVLSGRSFERSVVSSTDNRHPLRSIRRKPRDLLRLIKGGSISPRSPHQISCDDPKSPERRGRAFKPDRGLSPGL